MKIFAVVGLALAPAFAFAADPVASSSTDADLQGVVVTATRTPVTQADSLAQTSSTAARSSARRPPT